VQQGEWCKESYLERVVAHQLLGRGQCCVEGDLFDPLIQVLIVLGGQKKFCTVRCPQTEDVLALGIVIGPFTLRLVEIKRRSGRFALRKVVVVLKETQQLTTKN